MANLIILTTATCRPNIHNMTFNSTSLSFLDSISIPVKWIINIDKTLVCPSTQEKTQDNFDRLLKKYNPEYIVSKQPNFFHAFKNLILASEKHWTDDSIFLNLQDDFLANKPFQLQDIINLYYTSNSYISLVFNKFGSFPVALIGSSLFKHYKNAFLSASEKQINARKGIDHITAIYFRRLTLKSHPIHYFLINEDITSLKQLLKKKDKVIANMKINNKDFTKTFGNNSFTLNEPKFNKNNKNYLVTNTNLITKELFIDIKSTSDQKINIINQEQFNKLKTQYEQEQCFICIKFGGTHTYIEKKMDYNNTYFRDLGRFIGKSPKLAENYIHQTPSLTNENIIFTSYYFNQPDPQRKKYQKEDFNYIKPFYDSVKKLNLSCIIFHDGLSQKFINKYQTDKIKFILFKHEDYKTTSGNDTRYLVYLNYLRDKHYDKLIISDINGVEFLKDPFNIIQQDKIYVATSRIRTKKNTKRDLTHYWFKNCVEKTYGTFQPFENFKNKEALCAGYFCGNYNLINEILREFKKEFNRVNLQENTNFAVFNRIIYTKFRYRFIQGYSTHNGYEEIILPNKDYVLKIRNADVYGMLFFE